MFAQVYDEFTALMKNDLEEVWTSYELIVVWGEDAYCMGIKGYLKNSADI